MHGITLFVLSSLGVWSGQADHVYLYRKVLGKLLRLKGHNQSGSECFLTALNLEESEPVVSFDILPRSM